MENFHGTKVPPELCRPEIFNYFLHTETPFFLVVPFFWVNSVLHLFFEYDFAPHSCLLHTKYSCVFPLLESH